MAEARLTLRSVKGSPLTPPEGDAMMRYLDALAIPKWNAVDAAIIGAYTVGTIVDSAATGLRYQLKTNGDPKVPPDSDGTQVHWGVIGSAGDSLVESRSTNPVGTTPTAGKLMAVYFGDIYTVKSGVYARLADGDFTTFTRTTNGLEHTETPSTADFLQFYNSEPNATSGSLFIFNTLLGKKWESTAYDVSDTVMMTTPRVDSLEYETVPPAVNFSPDYSITSSSPTGVTHRKNNGAGTAWVIQAQVSGGGSYSSSFTKSDAQIKDLFVKASNNLLATSDVNAVFP